MRKLVVAILSLVMLGCGSGLPASVEKPQPTLLGNAEKPGSPFSEIDLTKIGHIAPKGRVQDKDYNHLEVIDQLIAHGKESVPYLISKLDDETVIHQPVMDYWYEVTVGDVAFVILTDFATDSTWKRRTIPGTSWEEILKRAKDPDISGAEFLGRFVERHGRGPIKSSWERIWEKYKDRISWDERERSFVLLPRA